MLAETLDTLKETFNDGYEGLCFVKHPLFGLSSDVAPPDIIVLSRLFGLIVLDIYDFKIEDIEKIENSKWYFSNWDWNEKELFEEGEDIIYSISGGIDSDRNLRKYSREDGRLKAKYFLYLPNITRKEWEDQFEDLYSDNIIFEYKLSEFFQEQNKFFDANISEDIWKNLIGLFTGIRVLIKPTRKVESEKTKAGLIRKVESQMQSLDLSQMKIAQQIPPGPQRIRGLAGTGKTIVLAMKAAQMHLQHPEWTIVYTFNTQSLYNYIYDLINKFYQHWTGGREPNWDKLKILHGWGGAYREGLYSNICKIKGERPKTYTDAKNYFDHKRNSELLGKCCDELAKMGLPAQFDSILIDEAQDFDKLFYQFCYKILKEPKRLIWAYDELQSLEDVTIPTAQEIFGVDADGIQLVDLEGVYSGGIEKDFVLFKSYRNPRIILMVAHIFGMGLMRKDGAV